MNEPRSASRQSRSPLRRAHRSLWTLVAVTIAMAGALTGSLAAPPGPLTGLSFAVSAVVFVVALALAARVTIALERVRRRSHPNTAERVWLGWRKSLAQLREPGQPRVRSLPAGSPPPGGRGEAGQIGEPQGALTETDRE